MTWSTFHNTVAAVIEKDNRFLLIEEIVQGKNVYNQPAGHLESNESLIDAIIRETLEETTFRFTPTHIIGIYLYQLKERNEAYLRIAFSGLLGEKVANAQLDNDILQTLWLSADEIFALPEQRLRNSMVTQCIRDYLKGNRYPIDMATYISSHNTTLE